MLITLKRRVELVTDIFNTSAFRTLYQDFFCQQWRLSCLFVFQQIENHIVLVKNLSYHT